MNLVRSVLGRLHLLSYPAWENFAFKKGQTHQRPFTWNQINYFCFRCFGGLSHHLDFNFRPESAAQLFSGRHSGHQLQLRGQDHRRLLCRPRGWLSALSRLRPGLGNRGNYKLGICYGCHLNTIGVHLWHYSICSRALLCSKAKALYAFDWEKLFLRWKCFYETGLGGGNQTQIFWATIKM